MVALIIGNFNTEFCSAYDFYKIEGQSVYYFFSPKTKHERIEFGTDQIAMGNSNTNNINFQHGNIPKGAEFSIINYEFKTGLLRGYRDPIGVKPFFYSKNDDFFIFSTSLLLIKELIEVTVNENWIANALSGIPPFIDETFYNEIKSLPPACQLIVRDIVEAKQLTIEPYFNFKISEKNVISNLREVFYLAVKSRITGDKIGSELSGGIDSSGISGVLASNLESKTLFCLRQVLSEKGKGKYFPFVDEKIFSDLVIHHHKNISPIDVWSEDKGIIKEMAHEMRIIGSPFYSSMVLFSDELFNKCRANKIDLLFSGFGGDEGVSNNGAVYIKELVSKQLWFELFRLTGFIFTLKQVAKYILPIKTEKWEEKKAQNSLLNEKWQNKTNIKESFWEHHNQLNIKNLNQSIINKLTNPTLTYRLTETGLSARERGVEYTFPLLDINLLEQYLSLDNSVKFNYKQGRTVFREIIKKYVPEKIALRNDKTGATVPSVLYRIMNDYDSIFDLLIKHRNGIASQFVNIEKMIRMLPHYKRKALGEYDNKRLDIRMFLIGIQMILYFDEKVLE